LTELLNPNETKKKGKGDIRGQSPLLYQHTHEQKGGFSKPQPRHPTPEIEREREGGEGVKVRRCLAGAGRPPLALPAVPHPIAESKERDRADEKIKP